MQRSQSPLRQGSRLRRFHNSLTYNQLDEASRFLTKPVILGQRLVTTFPSQSEK